VNAPGRGCRIDYRELVVGRWRLIGGGLAVGIACLLAWSAVLGQPSSRDRVDDRIQRYVPATGAERGGLDRSVSASRGSLDRFVSPSGSDRGPGTRARPWRTIGHAATRARPGYTVHVAPGRYAGPLTIARGGTEARPVRFVSDRRWRARIAAVGSEAITVVVIRADHVILRGFDVTGRGGPGTAGIGVEGSHDAVVGNRVRGVAAPCTGNGGAGIVVGGGQNGYGNRGGRIDGNLVEDIGPAARDGTCRLVHGIYAAVPGVTIVNNIVSRAAGDGITSWHAARTLTIVNNLSTTNGGAGILVGSGDSGATSAGHTDTLVSNNIVYRNALNGITESSDGTHPVGGNRYLHNLTFGNRRSDGGDDSGTEGLSSDAVVSGTVNADPDFARLTGSALSYGLRTTSPAVDAGTRAGAPRHDFDGTPRPRGRGIDIGPYELSARRTRQP
jgi:Right handed beta helix region/Protein of unknown function (DUF1565)